MELIESSLKCAWTSSDMESACRVRLYYSVTRTSRDTRSIMRHIACKHVYCTDWAELDIYMQLKLQSRPVSRDAILKDAYEDISSTLSPATLMIHAHPVFLCALNQLFVMRMAITNEENIKMRTFIADLEQTGFDASRTPLFDDAITLHLTAEGGHDWMRRAPSLRKVHIGTFSCLSFGCLMGVSTSAMQEAIGAMNVHHLVLASHDDPGSQLKPPTDLNIVAISMAFPRLKTLEIFDGRLMRHLNSNLPTTISIIIVNANWGAVDTLDIRPWCIPDMLERGFIGSRHDMTSTIVLRTFCPCHKVLGWKEVTAASVKHKVQVCHELCKREI